MIKNQKHTTMKKLILASAFALMATPALFAQSDNSFSMQIELKNGTKITLGPNDLKNISFVDGAIKIEGNTIEDLRMAIEKAEANTKNMVAEQRYDLNDLKKEAAELQAMIKYLEDKVDKLENAGGGSGNTEDITALQAAIATLQSELAKLQSSEMATKTDVAAMNEKVSNVQAMVKVTEAAIMDLQEAVKGLSSGSSGSGSVGNEERIKLLEEAVNKLKADMNNLSSIEQIKKLQAQIDDLMAMVNVVATNSTGNQAQTNELKVRLTAVEAALDNLSSYITTNQSNISELRKESLATNDKIAENKVELLERISDLEQELSQIVTKTNSKISELSNLMDDDKAYIKKVIEDLDAIKVELQARIMTLAEALAKTNNNLDSVSVTILQRTMAEIGKLEAAIVKESDGRQEQAAYLEKNIENKIETLKDIIQSKETSLQGLIDKETNDRMISINEVNKKILEKYNELKEELYWITKFLNSEAFPAANTFDNWLKEIQQR